MIKHITIPLAFLMTIGSQANADEQFNLEEWVFLSCQKRDILSDKLGDWCSGAGRKPQSQIAFKRSLEKLSGVYQHRSSNGLQWHGISPCLTY